MATKKKSKSAAQKIFDDAAKDLFTARTKEGVAYRLRLTRAVLGGNQGSFAKKADLNGPTYNQYETATTYPELDQANALCDAHRLTLDWIFRGNASGLRRDLEDALVALHKAKNDLD